MGEIETTLLALRDLGNRANDRDRSLATALAAERTAPKPHFPFAWQQRRRAEALPAAA